MPKALAGAQQRAERLAEDNDDLKSEEGLDTGDEHPGLFEEMRDALPDLDLLDRQRPAWLTRSHVSASSEWQDTGLIRALGRARQERWDDMSDLERWTC